MRLARGMGLGLGLGVLLGVADLAGAADMPARAPLAAPVILDQWTFRAVPYAWITGLNGSTTVKGRTVDVDASFLDILERTNSLLAVMGYFEAQKGPIFLFANAFYSDMKADAGAARSRAFTPHVVGTIGASLGTDMKMVIAEAGAGYEVFRWGGAPGAGTGTSIDVMGGVRYWWQRVSLDLALAATLVVGDLEVGAGRATARGGTVDWVDPFVGLRLRHQFAPGHSVMVSGDVGGFGVGSQFSWQLIGAYNWDFYAWRTITLSAVIGYRALYVDYAQGAGLTRYEFDMLTHGPLLGLSMRF